MKDKQHADAHAHLELKAPACLMCSGYRVIRRGFVTQPCPCVRTRARVLAAELGAHLESPVADAPGEGWGLTHDEELELTPAELRGVLRDDLGTAEASNLAKARVFARQVKFRDVGGGAL